MPTKLEFTKGEKCGKEDNCKSRHYYEQDGLKYCKRGHLQEVSRHTSQLSIKTDLAISRGKKRSQMRMTLAPRVGRPVSRGRNRKMSPKVGSYLRCTAAPE